MWVAMFLAGCVRNEATESGNFFAQNASVMCRNKVCTV